MSSVTQAYAETLLIVDPSASGTGFLAPSGGRPQLNIATPQNGVSVNKFRQFHVGPEGLILNNSRTGGVSVVGQNVTANANLVNTGPANTIVNEVTSALASSLTGETEVVGQKAAVIIANPNGISCNGCSFLNTSSSILTTGKPVVTETGVDLVVTQGTVTIGEKGFKTGGQAGIFGRHIILNGEVVKNDEPKNDEPESVNSLIVSGGAQKAKNLNFKKLSETEIRAYSTSVSKTSPFAIDSNKNGHLTGDDVRVEGLEAGLDVNIYGKVTAESFSAHSAGDLFYRDITVEQDVSLSGKEIRQYGNIDAGEAVWITGDSFTLYDGRVIHTKNSRDESGFQQGYIDIYTDDYITIAGEVSGPEIYVTSLEGSVTNNGFLLADGELQVFVDDSFLQQREVATEYDVYTDPVLRNYLDAYYEKLLNGGEEANIAAYMIARAGAHEIIAEYIDKGATSSGTNVTVVAGQIQQTSAADGAEGSNSEEDATNSDLTFIANTIGGDIADLVGGDITNQGGAIAATNNVILIAANDVINEYVSLQSRLNAADGCPAENCGYRVDFHAGEILAGNELKIATKGSIKNRASDIAAANDVALIAKADIKNVSRSSAYSTNSGTRKVKEPGRITSLYGDVKINAGGEFVSKASEISAGNDVGIKTESGGASFQSWNDIWAVSTVTARNISVISGTDLTISGGRFLASADLDLRSSTGDIEVDGRGLGKLITIDNSQAIGLVEFTGNTSSDISSQIFRSNGSDLAGLLQDNNLLTAVETLRRAGTGADIKDAVRSVGVQSFISVLDGGKLETLKAEAEAAVDEAQRTYETDLFGLYDSISKLQADTDVKIARLDSLLGATDVELEQAMRPELDASNATYHSTVSAILQRFENQKANIKAQHDPYLTAWWQINVPTVYVQHSQIKNAKLNEKIRERDVSVKTAQTRNHLRKSIIRASYTDPGLQNQLNAIDVAFDVQMDAYKTQRRTLFDETTKQINAALEKVQLVFDEQVRQDELSASYIKKGGVNAGAPSLAAALTSQEFGVLEARQAEVNQIEAHYARVMHAQHQLYLQRISAIHNAHAPYLTEATLKNNPFGYVQHANARSKEIAEAQVTLRASQETIKAAQNIKVTLTGTLAAYKGDSGDIVIGHKTLSGVSGPSLGGIHTNYGNLLADRHHAMQNEVANIAATHAPYLSGAMLIFNPIAYSTHANYKTTETGYAQARYLGARQTIEAKFHFAEAQEWQRLAKGWSGKVTPLISESKEVQDKFVAAVAWRVQSRQATRTTTGKLKNTLLADDRLRLFSQGDISLTEVALQGNDALGLLSVAGGIEANRVAFNAHDTEFVAKRDITARGSFTNSGRDLSVISGGNTSLTTLGKQTLGSDGLTLIISQDASVLNVGRNLSVDSLGEIAFGGVQVAAGGHVSLIADENVHLFSTPSITKLNIGDQDNGIDFYTLRPNITSITAQGGFSALSGNDALFEGARVTATGSYKEPKEPKTANSPFTSGQETVITSNNLKKDSVPENFQPPVSGGIQIAATNNVTLSAVQDVYDHEVRTKKSGTFSKSSNLFGITRVTNIGTKLTASQDLVVTAQTGNLTTAGTKFVSTGGDISLSAVKGDIYAGAYTDINQTRIEIHKSKFFGLISSIKNHTIDERIATGTTALANVDLTLVSGADTTLVGAQLSAGRNLKLDVGGDLVVKAAINSRREELFESKMGAVLATTKTEESYKETATYTTFNAGGNIEVKVGGNTIVTVYNYEGEEPNPTIQELFPDEITALTNLILYNEELADEYYIEETKTLSPAFTAVLTIALTQGLGSMLTAGSGVAGLTSTGLVAGEKVVSLNALGQAVVAGATSTTVGILNGAISGDLDLGEILKDAIFAAGTSYIASSINIAAPTENANGLVLSDAAWSEGFTTSLLGGGKGSLTLANIAENALDIGLTSAASSAVYGTDFGESFGTSFLKSIVSLGLADVQKGIGDNFADGQNGGEGSLGHILLHSAAGCAAAELSGASCGAGAAAGAAQAIFSGIVKSNEGAPDPFLDPVGYNAWRTRVAQSAELVGTLVGFAFSGGDADNVNAGASIARSGAENNYLTHEQWTKLISDMKQCGENELCRTELLDDAVTLSESQQENLQSCIVNNDVACVDKINKELSVLKNRYFEISVELAQLGVDIRTGAGQTLVYLDADDTTSANIYTYHVAGGSIEEFEQYASANCSGEVGDCLYQYGTLKGEEEMRNLGYAALAAVGIVAGVVILPEVAAACLASPVCVSAWQAYEAVDNASTLVACGAGDLTACGAAAINTVTPGNFADDFATATKKAPAATNRTVRSADELLTNGRVPGVRNGEFNRWFDDLSPAELDNLWSDTAVRRQIERRIREPRGLHEWCMACRAPEFRHWGVPMDEIQRFRTRTDELTWTHPDTGVRGGHGADGSGQFHNELRDIIDNSTSLDQFNTGVTALRDRWQIDPSLLPELPRVGSP